MENQVVVQNVENGYLITEEHHMRADNKQYVALDDNGLMQILEKICPKKVLKNCTLLWKSEEVEDD